MKKNLIALAALTSLMSLVGCGGTKQSVTKVTIKYVNSWGQNYQAKVDQLMDEFMAANPNITVEKQVEGGYDGIHTQTSADIDAGNGEHGDIVICYPDHVVDYINSGVAVDLDDLINDKKIGWTQDEKEDMIAGYMKEGQNFPISGTYCLPYCKSTEALYYNKDVLIGLDLSSVDPNLNNGDAINQDYIENLTWEEFLDVLCPAIDAYNKGLPNDEKIIRPSTDGGLSGICGYDSEANLFINLCEQYGYGYTSVNQSTGKASLDFNNDNVVALLRKFNEAGKKNYLVPSSRKENNSYCSSFFVEQHFLFNIGSTAGVTHEASNDFDVDVAPIPGAANGNKHIISQGPSLCILKHPEDGKAIQKARIEAAWKFYKFLTSSKNSAIWATTVGYLPVRYSSLEQEVYIDYADVTGKPARSPELLTAKNAQYSTVASSNVFTSPVFKGSSTARTVVGATMAKVLNHTDSVYSLSEIKGLLNEAVNEIKKYMEE